MRRRKMASDEDTSLQQSLLDHEEASSASVQPVKKPSQAIIVHPGSFDLHAFLQYILRCWSTVLGAVYRCLETVWPGSGQPQLSIIQEERLEELREKIAEPFDSDNTLHQDTLRQLWQLAFPDIPCIALKSPQWKEMGWQGEDPATDFRGAGYFGLCNLIYLAEQHPGVFDRLLHKTQGARAEWEYPFAVAGLNLTFMLADVMDLQDRTRLPRSAAGRAHLVLMSQDDHAFEEIYCLTFQLLDRTWLDMKASYMEFNQVQKKVKAQLELALASRPRSLQQLRSKMSL